MMLRHVKIRYPVAGNGVSFVNSLTFMVVTQCEQAYVWLVASLA